MLRSLRRLHHGGGEIKPFLLVPPFSCYISSSHPPPPTPISPSDLESLVLHQYRNGRFHALLSSVISHPSVLLAASLNLASNNHDVLCQDAVLGRLSIPSLSADLKNSAFDVDSCCVNIVPSRKKGTARIFPNLKLKVVMEAVRMVLVVVYEKRFVTFSYGGRVGMGRHTAVRYLKSSVGNPSWWFRVGFRRERFGQVQVSKLVELMEDKIEDRQLMALIERFFLSEAVVLEVGGVEMGRDFPQESGLSSILMNVYFDGFDHVIQDFRLEIRKKYPRIVEEGRFHAFHNPVRVYAVRYLDEILLVTSGSKMFMMVIHEKVVRILEGHLCLTVDKLRTSIHSAVSEKMDFMGMELQAVLPSVLHPPMSEKAMRAQKKYLKRKAAKALELRNARETRRKKLGLKILNHVFKKLKRVDGFKFEFRIEKEVREIFRGWADDVVKEFLSSKEECWDLHRALSSGDFLKLKKIRDQLPTELVVSYDLFQEKVDKYLMLHFTSNTPEKDDSEESGGGEEGCDEEEEEEKKYAKRTVEDLTTLSMRVNAPIELVRKAVKLAGFTNSMGRPRPIKLLVCLEDSNIVKWMLTVPLLWISSKKYFQCLNSGLSHATLRAGLLCLFQEHEYHLWSLPTILRFRYVAISISVKSMNATHRKLHIYSVVSLLPWRRLEQIIFLPGRLRVNPEGTDQNQSEMLKKYDGLAENGFPISP